LYLRWRSEPEVKMKKVQSAGLAPMRCRVSRVMSMSWALERHITMISRSERRRPLRLPPRISSRARRSEGAAEGKPMSMMCRPASESRHARSYFCSGVKATPGVCSPSRRVVS
jgi:hypothetical protein